MITHHGVHFGIFDLIDSYLICLSEFREWMQQLKYPFENVWLSGKRTQQTLNCWIASSPVIIFERKMRGGEEKRGKKMYCLLLILIRIACDVILPWQLWLAWQRARRISLISRILESINDFYSLTGPFTYIPLLLRLSLLQRVYLNIPYK